MHLLLPSSVHMRPTAAYICLLIVALLYSVCSALVKRLHSAGFPIVQLMCARIFASTMVVLPTLIVKGAPPCSPGPPYKRLLQASLSIAGVLDLACYFTANIMLPLGDATAIIGLYPAVTLVMARVWLKEKVDHIATAAILLACAGGLLITKPSFLFHTAPANGAALGYAIAALGCLFTSSQYLILRHPALAGVNTLEKLSWYLTLAIPTFLTAHLLLEKSIMPSAAQALAALVMGGWDERDPNPRT